MLDFGELEMWKNFERISMIWWQLFGILNGFLWSYIFDNEIKSFPRRFVIYNLTSDPLLLKLLLLKYLLWITIHNFVAW